LTAEGLLHDQRAGEATFIQLDGHRLVRVTYERADGTTTNRGTVWLRLTRAPLATLLSGAPRGERVDRKTRGRASGIWMRLSALRFPRFFWEDAKRASPVPEMPPPRAATLCAWSIRAAHVLFISALILRASEASGSKDGAATELAAMLRDGRFASSSA
jgi:hypothetical protein